MISKHKILLIILWILLFIYRWHFPESLAAQSIVVTGTIASIPESHANSEQFIFLSDRPKARLWISWYFPPPVQLHVGDVWSLHLKVKPVAKSWLVAEDINATGTVVIDRSNQVLQFHPWDYPINHIRENIYTQIQTALVNRNCLGFISALTIGIRDKITEQQWQDLRGTGTNHLMAIAGLHIGFAASIIYTLINFIWKKSESLLLIIPAQEAGVIGALLTAILYSALAGFALPTQRAVIMLSIFLIATLLRRHIPLWTAWKIALFIILAWEPLAILSASFWLSFGAVAFIIYGTSARLRQPNFWLHWGRVQLVIAIGLIPFSLYFFQQVSLVGFIANLIAIPWIGFIILPICLCGVISSSFSVNLSTWLWQLAEYLLNGFWPLMHFFANLPYSQWYQSINNFWILISTFFGIILLLAPKGWPARWLGLCWLLPLITMK